MDHVKKYVKIKIFAILQCSLKKTKILEFNQEQKPDKAPFIIYTDLDYLLEKTDGYKTNSEYSPTKK